MSEHARIEIGLIGAGAFGEYCLAAFAQMPEVRIVAVADVDSTRSHRLANAFGCAAYDDLAAMLSCSPARIIVINTPPRNHAELALQALSAGKHVFCEKPLALSVSDAEQVIAAAGERSLVLGVDYVMRHNPFWAALAEIRRRGGLGALRHLDLANHAAGLDLPPTHWFWDERESGGIWIEHGVHFFDAFRWVTGESPRVSASRAWKRSDGAVDRVAALLVYGNTVAHAYHGFDQTKRSESTKVTATFELGAVTLDQWVPATMQVHTHLPAELWAIGLPVKVEGGGRGLWQAESRGDKSDLYRQAIQAGLRDVARIIGVGHGTLKVSATDALQSLRDAVAVRDSAGR